MTALAPDAGVFELAGPTWIWAHTCPAPKCKCRSAIVIATDAGRDVLLALGKPIHDAWMTGGAYATEADKLKGVIVLDINIDSGEFSLPVAGGKRRQDRMLALLDRIDGGVLEELGRLWYLGKGLPDPTGTARTISRLRKACSGNVMAWNDAFAVLRHDYYRLDERVFEVVEKYGIVPGADVIVDFVTKMPRGGPAPGRIIVQTSGKAKLEPSKSGAQCLEMLWAAFRKRHPKHVERFAARFGKMREIGARLNAT